MQQTSASFRQNQHYIFLGAIILIALVLSRILYAPCDDAYIFLVYAKNFLAGNGLTFNGAVVEGFSSPLWLALLILFGSLRIPLPVLMQILSTLSGVLALFAAYHLAFKILKDRFWALLPSLLLAGSGDFVFYIGVGLEQVLFVALIAVSIAEVWEDPASSLKGFKIIILLPLLILTRPEGALIALMILVWTVVRLRSPGPPFLAGLKISAILAPIYILKRLYFGYWLPNTYYIKSNSGLANLDTGKLYLIRNGLRYWPVAVLFLLCLFLLLTSKKGKLITSTLPLLFMSAVWGMYVWVVGGDNLVGGRMLIPVLPLVYVALASWFQNSTPNQVAALLAVLVTSVILFVGYTQNSLVQTHTQRWRSNFPVRQAAGLYLKENFPPGTLVALNPAGIIPYYSELPTIDMLGLNDVYIGHFGERDFSLDFGHQAGDGDYVLSRQPDVILFGGGVSAVPGDLISDRQIANNPDFVALYQPVLWQGIGTAYIRTSGDG